MHFYGIDKPVQTVCVYQENHIKFNDIFSSLCLFLFCSLILSMHILSDIYECAMLKRFVDAYGFKCAHVKRSEALQFMSDYFILCMFHSIGLCRCKFCIELVRLRIGTKPKETFTINNEKKIYLKSPNSISCAFSNFRSEMTLNFEFLQ